MRHRNFVDCVLCLVDIGQLGSRDLVIQMARCSFDAHLSDILGSLIVGATLVMLHPKGNLDFHYLAQTLNEKQISLMDSVPTLLSGFFQFFESRDDIRRNHRLKSICSGGKFQVICYRNT